MVQITACRLFGAKLLSEQCWVIIKWTLRNKQHFNQNIKLLIHVNASENSVCLMVAILSTGRWVKMTDLKFDLNLQGTIELMLVDHDDVIKWKHFPRYWPFVRGIHRSPVNSPHKGQWRGALMFSLICAWINRKQLWGWWFEKLSCPLWRHCNDARSPAIPCWLNNISQFKKIFFKHQTFTAVSFTTFRYFN